MRRPIRRRPVRTSRRFERSQPDLTFEVEDCVARGNTVALRAVRRSAAGSQRGLVFVHVNGAGRIVERWSAYTPL